MFPGMTPQFPMQPLKCDCTFAAAYQSDNGSGLTMNNVSLGPEKDDRFIVVSVSLQGKDYNVELYTATFNGVATRRMGKRSDDLGLSWEDAAAYGAYVPAGTSMTLRVNWGGSGSNIGIAVYSITGLYSPIERRFDGWPTNKANFSVPVSDDRLIIFNISKRGGTYPVVTGGMIFDAENQADIGAPGDDDRSRRFYHGFFSGPANATWQCTNASGGTYAYSVSLR